MKNSLVSKPQSLGVKKDWLRARDIVENFPIGESTIYYYVQQGKLTPIKVSPRVTVYSYLEVSNLFKYGSSKVREIVVSIPETKRKKRRKLKLAKKQIAQPTKGNEESDKKMIASFISQREKEVTSEKLNTQHYIKTPTKLPAGKEGILGSNKNKKSSQGKRNV